MIDEAGRFEVYGKQVRILHNSGFFSNCSVAMHAIALYFNEYQHLPQIVDFSRTFAKFKDPGRESEDVYPCYFKPASEQESRLVQHIKFPLFSLFDYRKEQYDLVTPLIHQYFQPSSDVMKRVNQLRIKYSLELENVLTICYRGTDKWKDTGIGSFEDFALKAKEVMERNPDLKVVVQTDQLQFIEFCREQIGDIVWFEELPVTDTVDPIHDLVKLGKVSWASLFLAAIYLLSQSQHLVIHTGNVARWLCLYRGSTDNVHQFIKTKDSCAQGIWLSDDAG